MRSSDSPVMSSPSSSSWPLVALSSPASSPSSVLLPLPDGPIMAANWPRGIARSMPRRISTRCVGVSMVRVRRMTSIMGREMRDSSLASVMIMAVSFRLMGAGALLVALAGCGGAKQEPSALKPASPVEKPTPTPVDTRPVIAAFGDSLSAGLGLDTGQSYPDRLQHLIDGAGYHYRVVNLGVSGDT